MWRKLAPSLAAEFTVVVPDLRGYGDSAKPPAGPDNARYSKRALALDQVETMAALGVERFAVAGHDRGARVAHRLTSAWHRSTSCPRSTVSRPSTRRLRRRAGTFFLIQPGGLPERLIGAEAEFFLRHQFATSLRDPAKLEPEVFAEYLRCFKTPETIRATCDEYRAGASIDTTTAPTAAAMPLLVLWGERSSQGSGYDMLGVWREHAETVSG
jgi:haloacetate dehalogenase